MQALTAKLATLFDARTVRERLMIGLAAFALTWGLWEVSIGAVMSDHKAEVITDIEQLARDLEQQNFENERLRQLDRGPERDALSRQKTRLEGLIVAQAEELDALLARFVPPDDRLDLYRDADLQTRAVVPVADLPHVLMTSAPADKEALDGPLDEGFYGLFSFSLARSLDTQGPTATPAQILAGTKTELRRIQEQLYTRPPEPQLEGPPEKLQRPILRAAAETTGESAPPPRRAGAGLGVNRPDPRDDERGARVPSRRRLRERSEPVQRFSPQPPDSMGVGRSGR